MKTITYLNGAEKSILTPSKIVCIGRNYAAHARELNNAVPTSQIIFLKPNSAIGSTLTSSSLSLKTTVKDKSTDGSLNASTSSKVTKSNTLLENNDYSLVEFHHYESELCFLIKSNKIYAVAFGLDLTRRDTQKRLKDQGLPWERAKAFDGAAIFSHFMPVEISDISKLSLCLKINNRIVQQADVSMMLFKPTEIVDEILSFLSLEDGDIIMTGTPSGVGAINKGDEFNASVYLDYNQLIEHSWVAV
jgi:2-keto-4-pentenoate hydratase/2-oxohepta-3-ene-1,7-dioic acid hydratase in catechol pathway